MGTAREILRKVMLDTGTTQSTLATISGVRQPTISQILTGRIGVSDEQLERLLACMGYQLEVIRKPVTPKLNRSELRSWRLHRQLSTHLTPESLQIWLPTTARNIARLRSTVQGEPHATNLNEWERLLNDHDLPHLFRMLTGLDRHSIEMREVSPLSGLLPDAERLQLLGTAS